MSEKSPSHNSFACVVKPCDYWIGFKEGRNQTIADILKIIEKVKENFDLKFVQLNALEQVKEEIKNLKVKHD